MERKAKKKKRITPKEKRIKVRIRAKQVVHYDQEVMMTEKEFEKVKLFEGDIVDHSAEGYGVLEGHIDPGNILAADNEYTDVTVDQA